MECSTFSRARERDGKPQPLRSEEHVLVVKGGGHVVIENPERSHLWAMLAVSQLLTQGYQDVNYVACAYGGARCKHQKLRTTIPEFAQLSCACHHTHLQGEWKPTKDPRTGKYVYPTAIEAEYTAELAYAIAATITQVTAKFAHRNRRQDVRSSVASISG
eukprot:5137886-Amphidinium_carterae.2